MLVKKLTVTSECPGIVWYITPSEVGLELFSFLKFGFPLEVHPPHTLVAPVSLLKVITSIISHFHVNPVSLATIISQTTLR